MSEPTTPVARPSTGLPMWLSLTFGGVVFAAIATAAFYYMGPGYVRHGLGEDIPDGKTYWNVFIFGRWFVFLMTLILLANILHARRGGPMFIRRIAGLNAIDETVGRATEMGRPISFALGLGKLEIITLQAYVNPLVVCIWLGGLILAFGTGITFWPTVAERRETAAVADAVRVGAR